MPDTVESLTLLQQLEARKVEESNALATLVEKRDTERDAFQKREASQDAKPTDEERSAFVVAEEEFASEFDRRELEVQTLRRRIKEQEAIEERRQDAARAASPRISDVREPHTYRRDNQHERSYFLDLASRYHSTFGSQYADPDGAIERLERHSKEVAEDLPKREGARERRAQEGIERAERDFTGSVVGSRSRGLSQSPFERRTNPNRTDGQGGYFVEELMAA